MRVAVIGGGPAGSLAAHDLAAAGIDVTVFDPSHPREKPCGGGLTARALALLPRAPEEDPLPARTVETCVFESANAGVEVHLRRPMAVAARLEVDGWLLRQAIRAGARHAAERVVEVTGDGRVRRRDGEDRFDLIVGADGAGSVVRRSLLAPIPKDRLAMATGWYARGDCTLHVRFLPEWRGYLWLFPRHDHVGVGICAPLASVPTRTLLERLESHVARSFPALVEPEGGRYAHTIPAPSSDPRSIVEAAGERWALVGDAAGFADPITGEGLYFALRSAKLLARTIVAGEPLRLYAERALEDFGRDLVKAAAIRDRFYEPKFVDRMIRYGARSPAIREVLCDLVEGGQSYVGLKRRLVRAAPRFAWDSLTAWIGARASGGGP